jgi:hypothetical protein
VRAAFTGERGVISKGVAWDVLSLAGNASKSRNLHQLIPSCIAAANVLRTHAETVLLLAFAAASSRLRSSALNRTGTMLPLAFAFGNLGRPGLLALFDIAFGLLRSCRFDSRREYLAYADVKAHFRIAVNASHSLNGADARALSQRRDDGDLVIGIENVCHKVSLE